MISEIKETAVITDNLKGRNYFKVTCQCDKMDSGYVQMIDRLSVTKKTKTSL